MTDGSIALLLDARSPELIAPFETKARYTDAPWLVPVYWSSTGPKLGGHGLVVPAATAVEERHDQPSCRQITPESQAKSARRII